MPNPSNSPHVCRTFTSVLAFVFGLLSAACAPEDEQDSAPQLEPQAQTGADATLVDTAASHPDVGVATFGGVLTVGYRGPDGRIVLMRRQASGWAKQVLAEYSLAAPALAVYGGQLYIAWVGTDTEGRLNVMRTSDGLNWRDKWVVGGNHLLTPALVVYGDRLNAFVPTYNGDNPDRGFQQFIFNPSGLEFDYEVGPADRASPSAVVYGNELFLTWAGFDKRLKVRKFIPGAGWQPIASLSFGADGTLFPSSQGLLLATRPSCPGIAFYRSTDGRNFQPVGFSSQSRTNGRPVIASASGDGAEFVFTSNTAGQPINVAFASFLLGSAANLDLCLNPIAPEEVAASILGDCLDRDPTDNDRDGLPDSGERCVAEKHVPEFMFHAQERYRPASVDWILARSRLRFAHGQNLEDITSLGLTQQRLLEMKHPQDHTRPSEVSITSREADRFVLSIPPGAFPGATDRADWTVYAHVYPNDIGGVTVQYFLSYPYSDAVILTHEGDWESVMVRRRRGGAVVDITTAAHGTYTTNPPNHFVTNGTHPRIWIGLGTHAHFANASICNTTELYGPGGVIGGGCDEGRSTVWQPWSGGNGGKVVNVGELGAPLNGQLWVNANVAWGGSAPPSFTGNWGTGRVMPIN